jgi:hypothetical protein
MNKSLCPKGFGVRLSDGRFRRIAIEWFLSIRLRSAHGYERVPMPAGSPLSTGHRGPQLVSGHFENRIELPGDP